MKSMSSKKDREPSARKPGRPKGSRNKRPLIHRKINEICGDRNHPLGYLVSVYLDEGNPLSERIRAATAAAPYLHSKMAAQIKVESETNQTVTVIMRGLPGIPGIPGLPRLCGSGPEVVDAEVVDDVDADDSADAEDVSL